MVEESSEKKARDLFSKIGQSLRTGAEVFVQETRELSKVGKLKVDLLALENERSKKFEEIGNLTYRAHKAGQDFSSKLSSLFQDIDEIEASISAKNEEIERLHGEDEPNKESNDEVERKQPVTPSDIGSSSSAAERPLFCSNCGSPLNVGDKFCKECGTRVG